MHVARARQPGTEVEELGDPLLRRQVADGPAEEGPVLPGGRPDGGQRLDRLLGDLPVSGEVVRAAEVVVVHPRWMRLGRIDLRHGSSYGLRATPPLTLTSAGG